MYQHTIDREIIDKHPHNGGKQYDQYGFDGLHIAIDIGFLRLPYG